MLLDFIERCDAYCARTGRSREWLSKRLFGSARALREVEAGRKPNGKDRDIGVRRLQRAMDDLVLLEGDIGDAPIQPAGAQEAAA